MVEARIGLGWVYLEQNQPQLAIDHFNAALASGTQLGQINFGLAQGWHALGRTQEEITAYQRALEAEPRMTAALQNLGNAYMTGEQYEQAAEMYRRAIETEPTNPALHYNLGVAAAHQKLHQEAINAFSEAITLEPANAAAYNGLAIAYYQLNDFEKAYAFALKAKSLGYEVQDVLLQKRN